MAHLLFPNTVTINPASFISGKCTNKFLRSIAPWDSSCYYSTLFEQNTTVQNLKDEHEKLHNYTAKKGLSPNVHWYRSLFYRTYFTQFSVTLEQIEKMHAQYTKLSPNVLNPQLDYFEYLIYRGETQRAQDALNNYCEKHIPLHLTEVFSALESLIQKRQLNLTLSTCSNKFQITN